MSGILLRSAAAYGLTDLSTRIVGLAVFPVYAQIFSVEEFGLFALMTSGVALCAIFANLGMNSSMQRYYLDQGATDASRRSVVFTGLALITASCLAVTLVVGLLIGWPGSIDRLEGRGISLLLALSALGTVAPGQLLQYAQDVLRVRFALGAFAVVAVMKSLLGVLIGLALVVGWSYRVEGLFIGQLVASLIAVPVALWLVREDLSPSWLRPVARKMMDYGWPLALSGLGYWIVASMDVWLLSLLSSQTEVGLYGAATRVVVLMAFVNAAFGMAWAPYALKTFAEDSNYPAILGSSFSLWLYLISLLGLIVVLFSAEIFWLLTPPAYWSAAPTLSGLAAGAVMQGSTQITVLGLSLARRTRTIAACAWAAATIHLLTSLLLVPHFGAVGAGATSVVSFSILSALYMVFSQRAHPLKIDWLRALVPVFAVWGSFAAVLLLDQSAPSTGTLLLKLAAVAAFLLAGQMMGIVTLARLRSLAENWRR